MKLKATERLRQQIQRALALGAAQKVIAQRIGVSASVFSRWLSGKPDSKGRHARLPVDAIDNFDLYLDEWAEIRNIGQPEPAGEEQPPAGQRRHAVRKHA